MFILRIPFNLIKTGNNFEKVNCIIISVFYDICFILVSVSLMWTIYSKQSGRNKERMLLKIPITFN